MVALQRIDIQEQYEGLPIDQVVHGDCLEILKTFPSNSVSAIVTDPPSSIHFMGEDWDSDKGGRTQWVAWLSEVMQEALRCCRPGGHALIWALPRTSHWTGMALEDAGWEVRDVIAHLFGSGFPKNHNISAAIDKELGVEREVQGLTSGHRNRPQTEKWVKSAQEKCHVGVPLQENGGQLLAVTFPATPEAAQWQGFGSALKPAVEIWWNVRKPLTTVPGDEIIVKTTLLLEALLWSLSPVELVKKCSRLNPHGQHEAPCNSVRWIANVLDMLVSPDLSEMMDTFNSPEMASMYLSIAWLWNSILDALCSSTNTYTTLMKTNLITELKTLNSWLSAIIPEDIIQVAILQNGLWSIANTVQNPSSAIKEKWQHIPTPSVQETVGMPITRNILSSLVTSAELLSLDMPTSAVNSAHKPALTDTIEISSKKHNSPAVECWWLCRKPLSEKNIAQNVLTWGCGGLNIDQCRVTLDGIEHHRTAGSGAIGTANGIYSSSKDPINRIQQEREQQGLNPRYDPSGRFPSNLVMSHDPRCIARGTKQVRANGPACTTGSASTSNDYGKYQKRSAVSHRDAHGLEEVPAFECHPSCPVRVLGEQSGERNSHGTAQRATYGGIFGNGKPVTGPIREGDTGTAARYFQQFHDPLETLDAPFHYFSKSSRRDRNSGLEGMPAQHAGVFEGNADLEGSRKIGRRPDLLVSPQGNTHPTCKSTSLMSWLCRLVGVPGGVILDPFGGSGSTAVACIREGFHFLLVEQEQEYVDIARARIAHAQQESKRAESEGQEYECVDSCPIKQLDAQSGIRKSGARIHPVGEAWPIWDTDTSKRARHTEYEASEGGASRYFQQFAPEPVSLWDEEVAE